MYTLFHSPLEFSRIDASASTACGRRLRLLCRTCESLCRSTHNGRLCCLGNPTDPVTATAEGEGRDWEKIARKIGGDRSKARTAVHCLSHYQRCLNIKLLNSKWTKEEDERLLAAVAKYGAHDWRGPICQELPNRTADQIIQVLGILLCCVLRGSGGHVGLLSG